MQNLALISSASSENSPCSFLNTSRSLSVISLIPLSTYNVKDFSNSLTKLLASLPASRLMFQKVFSVQISNPVGIKIRIRKQIKIHYKQEGIQQTSEEEKFAR